MRHITTNEFEFSKEQINEMLITKALSVLEDKNREHYNIETNESEGFVNIKMNKSETILAEERGKRTKK